MPRTTGEQVPQSLSRAFGRTFLAVAGGALVVAVLTSWLAPGRPATSARIVALASPGSVVAGEQVALYLGVADVPPGARAWVRVCRDVSCPVDRIESLDAGDLDWTWLANARLPADDYLGEAFLQVPTAFGMRTVDSTSWQMRARP